MARTLVCNFKNGIKDLSGYESPITLVGNPVQAPGKYDQGVTLSNSNAFNIPWPTGALYLDPTGGKAFAMWVNGAAGTTGITRVLYHGGNWKVYLQDASGNVSVTVSGVTLSSGSNVCDGTWHHILVAYTASDGHLTWYIDGTQTAQTSLPAQGFESGVTGWFGANDEGGEWANATISDLTVWPDPVVSGDVAGIMAAATTDLRQGLYGFEVHPSGKVLDASETGNALDVSSVATFPAGIADGGTTTQGMRVSSQITLPFTMVDTDRAGLALWANIDSSTPAGELIALLDGSTPRHSIATDGFGNIIATTVLDNGTTWTATTTGMLAGSGAWHHLHLGLYTSANTMYIDGNVAATGGPGGGGNNSIILSNIDHIRINPGFVMDDLRVLANLVVDETIPAHTQISARLQTLRVIGPTPTGISRDDGTPLQAFLSTSGGLVAITPTLIVPPAPDTTAPTVPTSLASSNITTSSFTIGWTASTDTGSGVLNYDVAVTVGGVENIIASTSSTSLMITDLAASTAYPCRVRARDKAGNVSTYASLTVTTATPLPTVVAAYNFDEGTGTTAADSAGTRDLTGLSSSFSWYATGEHGGAIQGDPTSGANNVVIPNFSGVDTASRTVSAWVQCLAVPAAGCFWAYRDSTSSITFGLYDYDGGQMKARWRAGSNNFDLNFARPANSSTTWNHVAMTWDGTAHTGKVFLNGVQVPDSLSGATSIATGGVALPTSTAVTVLDWDGNLNSIRGIKMDDLRFYDFAQTAAQITADMGVPVS